MTLALLLLTAWLTLGLAAVTIGLLALWKLSRHPEPQEPPRAFQEAPVAPERLVDDWGFDAEWWEAA